MNDATLRSAGLRIIGLAALVCLTVAAEPAPPLHDVAYEPDAINAHRLDLYVPAQRSGAPLVVFVYGGAFMQGDRHSYAPVGAALARRGMAVVIPSYRLYPVSNAEGAAADVAAAVAWTLAHAASYGLDASKVVLVGHSAGAQIVSMLGTHHRYLSAAGTSLQAVQGVFPLAGAYDLRDLSDEPESWQRIDAHIFGDSVAARAAISPGLNIDDDAPPFEAACGTNDDPGSCPRTLWFVKTLRERGIEAKAFREIGVDHMGLLRAFLEPSDPLYAEFGRFVGEHQLTLPH